jgi:hypothetical protein
MPDGHTVYTPSLTGLGDRRHLARPGINLDTHTDDIVKLILQENLSQVILVGWLWRNAGDRRACKDS